MTIKKSALDHVYEQKQNGAKFIYLVLHDRSSISEAEEILRRNGLICHGKGSYKDLDYRLVVTFLTRDPGHASIWSKPDGVHIRPDALILPIVAALDQYGLGSEKHAKLLQAWARQSLNCDKNRNRFYY